jgi:hypothetical protein
MIHRIAVTLRSPLGLVFSSGGRSIMVAAMEDGGLGSARKKADSASVGVINQVGGPPFSIGCAAHRGGHFV